MKPVCRGCKIRGSWNRSSSRSSRQALWLFTGLWGKSEERQCLFSSHGVGRFGMFKIASPFLSFFYALLSFSCSCLLFSEINLSLLLSSKNRYASPSNEPRTGVPSNTALKITFAEQKTKTEEKQTWGKWLSGQVQLFWGDRQEEWHQMGEALREPSGEAGVFYILTFGVVTSVNASVNNLCMRCSRN